MKKQLLTAAVAAAIVLPTMAQAGVYGRMDGVLRMNDSSTTDLNPANNTSRDAWDVGADKLRWGIVGSEDLGNGMKAIYHYEFDMATNDQGNGSTVEGGTTWTSDTQTGGRVGERTRLAYAGLEGGWGKFVIGRNWVQSYGAVYGKTDYGNAHAAGPTNLSGNRKGNQLQYTTPSMSGFKAGIDLTVDDNDTSYRAEDGIDRYEVSAMYSNGPLSLGATFGNTEQGAENCTVGFAATSCKETDQWGIAGSYSFGDLTVDAHYVDQEISGGANAITRGTTTVATAQDVDYDGYAIGATYKMGSTHLYGAYRTIEGDWTGGTLGTLVGNSETDDWHIGVQHFMSKETRVFAEYRDVETDVSTNDGSVRFSTEAEMFAVGLRKDWKL